MFDLCIVLTVMIFYVFVIRWAAKHANWSKYGPQRLTALGKTKDRPGISQAFDGEGRAP